MLGAAPPLDMHTTLVEAYTRSLPSRVREAERVVRLLPTKPCRTRVGDNKEWRNGRRAPTQDPSTNDR